MVLSKREDLLPGPGLAWSFWFMFFLQLWLLYFLLSWSFFGRYLGCNSVPGQGLDSCCCFGWLFRCSLGRCFCLCFCVVGCLAPGLGPCMVVLVPVSYNFGCYFLHLMKHS